MYVPGYFHFILVVHICTHTVFINPQISTGQNRSLIWRPILPCSYLSNYIIDICPQPQNFKSYFSFFSAGGLLSKIFNSNAFNEILFGQGLTSGIISSISNLVCRSLESRPCWRVQKRTGRHGFILFYFSWLHFEALSIVELKKRIAEWNYTCK